MCQMKSLVIFPMHQKVFNQGLIPFFFNSLCTLMWKMESTTTISTSLSARSLRVHFDLLSGGSEQARKVNCASTFPSNFRVASLRVFSCNAKFRSPSQYLFLIRLTMDLLTLNVSDISLSGRPSSARSNILAESDFSQKPFRDEYIGLVPLDLLP
jgi:hypothetical protein